MMRPLVTTLLDSMWILNYCFLHLGRSSMFALTFEKRGLVYQGSPHIEVFRKRLWLIHSDCIIDLTFTMCISQRHFEINDFFKTVIYKTANAVS